MYAETGILFPYFQSFAQEVQLLEDLCSSHNASPSLTSTISEYDLGGEGDLFKAPEPIMEEPLGSLDPMAAAISMLSCGEEAISSQGFEQSEIESFQNEQLLTLSEVFYECKKDLLEISAIDSTFPDMNLVQEEILLPDSPFQKSVSSGCLSSMDWLQSSSLRPSFLDFPGMDFGSVYGMRRAYSEGDIKGLRNVEMFMDISTGQDRVIDTEFLWQTLTSGNGNGNSNGSTNLNQSSSSIVSNCTSEERKEKLSRYRNKKSKRNFGRKIKYACRKALADSQPRIRGRFAKTEDSKE